MDAATFDVGAWLAEHKLGALEKQFEARGTTLQELIELEERDIDELAEEMGLDTISKKRLSKGISSLKARKAQWAGLFTAADSGAHPDETKAMTELYQVSNQVDRAAEQIYAAIVRLGGGSEAAEDAPSSVFRRTYYDGMMPVDEADDGDEEVLNLASLESEISEGKIDGHALARLEAKLEALMTVDIDLIVNDKLSRLQSQREAVEVAVGELKERRDAVQSLELTAERYIRRDAISTLLGKASSEMDSIFEAKKEMFRRYAPVCTPTISISGLTDEVLVEYLSSIALDCCDQPNVCSVERVLHSGIDNAHVSWIQSGRVHPFRASTHFEIQVACVTGLVESTLGGSQSYNNSVLQSAHKVHRKWQKEYDERLEREEAAAADAARDSDSDREERKEERKRPDSSDDDSSSSDNEEDAGMLAGFVSWLTGAKPARDADGDDDDEEDPLLFEDSFSRRFEALMTRLLRDRDALMRVRWQSMMKGKIKDVQMDVEDGSLAKGADLRREVKVKSSSESAVLLRMQQTYLWRVREKNRFGWSQWSDAQYFATRPLKMHLKKVSSGYSYCKIDKSNPLIAWNVGAGETVIQLGKELMNDSGLVVTFNVKFKFEMEASTSGSSTAYYNNYTQYGQQYKYYGIGVCQKSERSFFQTVCSQTRNGGTASVVTGKSSTWQGCVVHNSNAMWAHGRACGSYNYSKPHQAWTNGDTLNVTWDTRTRSLTVIREGAWFGMKKDKQFELTYSKPPSSSAASSSAAGSEESSKKKRKRKEKKKSFCLLFYMSAHTKLIVSNVAVIAK